jgi:broad specificity phosphatase PhoE
MSIAWIRHGEKTYKNGESPSGRHNHDPPLKDNVREKVLIVCNRLDHRFNCPSKILCSPFTRTRETAVLIQDFFYRKYGYLTPIYVDNDVSEFLGWKHPQGAFADVSRDTRSYINPILGSEKLDDVRDRSKKHADSIQRQGFTIVVTHGIVIDYIHRHLTGYGLRRVKELRGITLNNGIIRKI